MSKEVDDYAAAKNKLTQLILKKQALEASLNQLEESIYEKESDYFNESVHGNIVKGFENFTKSSSSSNKKRMVYSEDDHKTPQSRLRWTWRRAGNGKHERMMIRWSRDRMTDLKN